MTDQSNQRITLAEATVGTPYGHVPGHSFHDVTVKVTQRGAMYRCVIVEVWGSAQGFDQVQGRKRVSGNATDWAEAMLTARERAEDTDIDQDLLTQAFSEAEDAMTDREEEE